MPKAKFNISLSFHFKPEPSITFQSLIPLTIVKNVVLRRVQIQRSCSIADCSHWIKFGKMKGMIICSIFIHRICDIIRRSMVFAYRHFQHFQYLLSLIVYFICFTAAARRNQIIWSCFGVYGLARAFLLALFSYLRGLVTEWLGRWPLLLRSAGCGFNSRRDSVTRPSLPPGFRWLRYVIHVWLWLNLQIYGAMGDNKPRSWPARKRQ